MRTLAIATIAAVVGSATAQNVGPLPPLTAQVEVHVVNVDVCVTDASGNPVAGLTKDDFQILEDGRPEKISNFSVVATPSPGHVVDKASPTTLRRRILLIIDNNYLSVVERNQALDAI